MPNTDKLLQKKSKLRISDTNKHLTGLWLNAITVKA